MTETALKDFADIVTGADENINLVEAALVVAANEYPDLDSSVCRQTLEMMADELQLRILGCTSTGDVIAALNGYLFDELGFAGDLSNFNDPRNSYLNDVLERRLGIPLSLSLLYMELGRRIGLCINGVSFPGHFLVRLQQAGVDLVLDPFAGGLVLDEQELRQRLRQFKRGGRADSDLQQLLAPASNRAILARMLRNLKNIYLEAEDFDHALEIANFLLVLLPGDPDEVRDRAHIYDRLDCYRAAIADYQHYLMLQPVADDHPYVQTRLTDLRLSAGRLH